MNTSSHQQSDNGAKIVTIGTFDGVHRGHQFLIKQIVNRARERSGEASIVTFEPVPISVLRPDAFHGRICSPDEKLKLLGQTGADTVVTIPFTRDLARLTADQFLSNLRDSVQMSEIWIGSDFALGRNRAGDVTAMRQIGLELGFEVVAVDRQSQGAQEISSTQIRLAIQRGDIALANALLGRPFRVSGEVIHGAHLGRTIGYPTANFVPPDGIVSLADGIYASIAYLDKSDEPLPGMTYIGTRPTVDGVDRQVETNLFDFDCDIYGRALIVDIIDRMREDRQFDTLDGLVKQLGIDESNIRDRLLTETPHPTLPVQP